MCHGLCVCACVVGGGDSRDSAQDSRGSSPLHPLHTSTHAACPCNTRRTLTLPCHISIGHTAATTSHALHEWNPYRLTSHTSGTRPCHAVSHARQLLFAVAAVVPFLGRMQISCHLVPSNSLIDVIRLTLWLMFISIQYRLTHTYVLISLSWIRDRCARKLSASATNRLLVLAILIESERVRVLRILWK